MSSQKHKTKDGNVMSFIIQRLEANGELSTKLRMRVKIWLKYVKTVILRRTTSSHATLCSIMQLGADKEAAIVIQILNSISHFCLVAFKPLWHQWIPNIDRMFACRSRCMDCRRRGETAMNMISLKNLWSNAKERNHSNVRLQT